MRKFRVFGIEMWLHQNDAEFTGAWFDGVCQDNFIVSCKRGYAACYECGWNKWTGTHEITWVPYSDKAGIDRLFAEFYARQEEAERQAEEIERLQRERRRA